MFTEHIKKLTSVSCTFFLVSILCSLEVRSEINQKLFKTHLRWSVDADKDHLNVSKNNSSVKIETLNKKLFDELKMSLSGLKPYNQYIKRVDSDSSKYPEGPLVLKVDLADNLVELFYFYRSSERKYILDFWKDELDQKISKTKVNLDKKIVKKELPKKIIKKKTAFKSPKKKVNKKSETLNLQKISKNEKFRDFRYGASLIWDHEPLSPKLVNFLNLKSKTPEHFYEVQNRDEPKKNKKEAHLQLIINLYKKEKWGLMYKSIELYSSDKFQKIYNDPQRDLLDYVKANSILRKNIANNEEAAKKLANNLYEDIVERTTNYQLKKAILLYLVQYHLDKKGYIASLKYGQKLYIETLNNFDREISMQASEVILYCLANLNQVAKIQEFLNDKVVTKLLPKEVGVAYQYYSFLKQNKYKEIIKLENRNLKAIGKRMDSIVYNLAEAYFRNGEYDKSISLFDNFVSNYSYNSFSSFARLRLAMVYELLDKDIKQTLKLYENVINRSSLAEATLEAKIRYVGLRIARNKFLKPDDIEMTVLLNTKKDEEIFLKGDMKTTLWLVRLRTLISQNKLNDALTYLNAIPLNTLKPPIRRMFQGDGAEIILGLLSDFYKKNQYGKIVKYWNIYKDLFLKRVAKDPYSNFIVSYSYLDLGLRKNYLESKKELLSLSSKQQRTFPIWVEREKSFSSADYMLELEILEKIEFKKFKEAAIMLADESTVRKIKKGYFYLGYINYELKNYDQAVRNLEYFLSTYDGVSELKVVELKRLFSSYAESLYGLKQYEKFKNSANALLNDLENNKKLSKNKLSHLKERINYLLLESIANLEKKGMYLEIESRAKNFLATYNESIYKGRVKYLFGKSLLENLKQKEGEKVLNEIIQDKNVPGYIKKLAETEIQSLRIKEEQL